MSSSFFGTDLLLQLDPQDPLYKLAKNHGVQQCRTYVKEVKCLRLSIRHFVTIKKRAKARKALKRLRAIAHKLIRELRITLPTYCLFDHYQKDFLLYEQVLS